MFHTAILASSGATNFHSKMNMMRTRVVFYKTETCRLGTPGRPTTHLINK
jgi:hypothetical protein